MGTNECSQPASKSPWDSQDFGDISPPGHDELSDISVFAKVAAKVPESNLF